MEIASYSSHSPLRLCDKRPRNLCASSLLRLCSSKGLCTVSSPSKQAILRYSYNSAQNSLLHFPRKHVGVSWQFFSRNKKFSCPYYDDKFHNRNKMPRHVVVRSELAESGTTGAAYPLTELQWGSKVRGIFFYAVSAIAATFLFVLMLVAHPFVLLLDRYQRRFHHLIAKIWAKVTVTPFFIIELEGLENLPLPDTPAVYISNHQSFLDIYTLLTLGRGFKFISKTGIFLIPIIGWAMLMMGVIPLKRMDRRSQLESVKRCMDLIKKGASVFFFPEGTRSKDGKLGNFKKGAFSIAAKARVPVIPMTLIGTGKIMPAGMEGILNMGSVKVIIHKPIEGSDPEVMCNEARNKIALALNHQG
ncbi:Acyltransferase domain-containing protein [Cephalotus follicularis]|uniref:1-acyl-sn-glycerol-3-phosphate acyltransferase n=1 Tax=Cephalotus follicularis TaxID=3775 RepID=A0A1Q3CSK2_CEPFO|nr:Acyltransferase domain-containing protein [Cephalotus follicularis]